MTDIQPLAMKIDLITYHTTTHCMPTVVYRRLQSNVISHR